MRLIDNPTQQKSMRSAPEVGGAPFSFSWGIRYQEFQQDLREGVYVSWVGRVGESYPDKLREATS